MAKIRSSANRNCNKKEKNEPLVSTRVGWKTNKAKGPTMSKLNFRKSGSPGPIARLFRVQSNVGNVTVQCVVGSDLNKKILTMVQSRFASSSVWPMKSTPSDPRIGMG
uniref:(northern house mosquito) hypothetical protein n=1 Tax=Culex pipiens TaxID=7175 RepID=A0A8D8FHX8_CULPI